ncbi:MAG: hypothetical protein JW839_16270 [Candidatus Lokiarchaeota archaeon]|nr:hypothetical protein [Candidatus Lokiarchaeota archaeon]
MNQSSDTTTSLEAWLARSYARFLQGLGGLASKAGQGRQVGAAQGNGTVGLSPFLPVAVDARFLESAMNHHALELAGALYRVLEVVIDAPARRVLAASVIAKDAGEPVRVIAVDVGSIQGPVADVLGKAASVPMLDDAALGALFDAAGKAKPVGDYPMPAVDVVRVVDASLFEQLMAIDESDAPAESIDAISRRVATILAGCRDGLVRIHPVKDKLISFACKAGAAIRGTVFEDIASATSTFLPAGSAAVVLHTGEAMTAFRVKCPKAGGAIVDTLPVTGGGDWVPVVPDVLDDLADKIRRDAGVDVVLFLSLGGIVGPFTTIVDGIASREHDSNGPGLVQAVLESLGLYIRTFKLTWYSKPHAMLAKPFPRLLLRLAGVRLDLPRFLHDRAATAVVSALLGNFGQNFTIVICFHVKGPKQAGIKAVELTVKNLIPVEFASVDPAVLKDLDMDSQDAGRVAQVLHDRLSTAAPSPGSRFVLAIGPKVASAVASAWKAMFRRVAWNPFSLLGVIKRCRDPSSLGLHPMPQGIGELLKSKPKDVARRLSKAFILKY